MKKTTIKKMAVFAGGLVLSGTISYSAINNIFEVKPFTQNKYAIYKVNLREYNENGVKDNPYYSKDGNFNKNILTNSIFIRTPFYTDSDGIIRRDVYTYDSSILSQDEINYVIDNIGNQELLLSRDYIKNVIEAGTNNYGNLKNIDGLNFINSETSNLIPYNNDFEISYAEYDPDFNETIYYNSKYLDNCLNVSYVSGNLASALILYVLYFCMESSVKRLKDNKKKVKKLDIN